MERSLVVILDFGSQYTQLIARRVREERVYCEIHPCTIPLADVRAMKPSAVILSGGPSSVFDAGAPTIDRGVFELGVPVLGICYGMQLFCHLLGGGVEKAPEREYGPAKVEIKEPIGILTGFEPGEQVDVWASHGDRVTSLPPGFRTIASTPSAPFAAAAITRSPSMRASRSSTRCAASAIPSRSGRSSGACSSRSSTPRRRR